MARLSARGRKAPRHSSAAPPCTTDRSLAPLQLKATKAGFVARTAFLPGKTAARKPAVEVGEEFFPRLLRDADLKRPVVDPRRTGSRYCRAPPRRAPKFRVDDAYRGRVRRQSSAAWSWRASAPRCRSTHERCRHEKPTLRASSRRRAEYSAHPLTLPSRIGAGLARVGRLEYDPRRPPSQGANRELEIDFQRATDTYAWLRVSFQ